MKQALVAVAAILSLTACSVDYQKSPSGLVYKIFPGKGGEKAQANDFIKYNMEKAMYLIDDSGLKQYNNLKEKGYFNTILASSATVTIMTDSIKVDMNNLSFEYYGIQRIERETSILKRQLVTTGKLRQIPRTENNPHGLIITDWKTILNKDLDYKVKKNF